MRIRPILVSPNHVRIMVFASKQLKTTTTTTATVHKGGQVKTVNKKSKQDAPYHHVRMKLIVRTVLTHTHVIASLDGRVNTVSTTSMNVPLHHASMLLYARIWSMTLSAIVCPDGKGKTATPNRKIHVWKTNAPTMPPA